MERFNASTRVVSESLSVHMMTSEEDGHDDEIRGPVGLAKLLYPKMMNDPDTANAL